ncbi:hypothetical protein ACKTEK_03775 [Tepidamorphus sp. 3E244]|uniref:hypothetical protein n=1 Tax=Tepidamorphus sp. 3E244 TaxID=3385498 RepID=UPI0038FC1E0A
MDMAVQKPVLIVEDDPFIAMDAEDAIISAGLECLVAHDCKSAFAILESHALAGALLDFDLRGENSIPIAAKLEEAGYPYFFVTGRTTREVTEMLGSNAPLFNKPVDYSKIAAQLFAQI